MGMFRRVAKTIIIFGLLAAGLQANAAKEAVATANVYEIDPGHTFVLFKASHLGFSHVYGRFTDVKGTFEIDEKKPEASKVSIVIDVASLDTQEKKRDQHLKGPDFFNAKQNPKITFNSTAVKKGKGETYQVTGDLTLNGKTQKVSFDFNRLRTGKDPWGNTKTGGDFTFTVKRSEFGINYMLGPDQIADEVQIIASVEGGLKTK